MSNYTAKLPHEREIFGHPVGLFILFFTETWERYSYYGMRALLALYLSASATAINPGLGWSTKDALSLYGWYTMLAYMLSIPGGYVADKFLGQKKTAMIGGIMLCIGHGLLAFSQYWTFFLGLIFIIIGVGALKPNVSTMVGGLYPKGDIRRDTGFTIFYIGINIGAFLSGISVGLVAYYYGWHYGFGLSGVGMILGQLVYIFGQKYLAHVGNFNSENKKSKTNKKIKKTPLSKVEKDRIIVLLISFLIIIVFWGAFEQAGGLMNLYTDSKINRNIGLTWLQEIPASVFQSLNAGYIILFGTLVGAFWVKWNRKGKESSSLFKMAIGTIIMGLGYIFMMIASKEASSVEFGKAMIIWVMLAYLFHTIGELCCSPVSLSFITKLAPQKYASIMMGIYFAASGLGNKIAGGIGELSQLKSFKADMNASVSQIHKLTSKEKIKVKTKEGVKYVFTYPIDQDKNFVINSNIYIKDGKIQFEDYRTRENISNLLTLSNDFEGKDTREYIKNYLIENNASVENPFHTRLLFEKKDNISQVDNLTGSNEKNYGVSFVIEEQQNKIEYRTFMYLTLFTVLFGILLIVVLKKLKKLTHNAES